MAATQLRSAARPFSRRMTGVPQFQRNLHGKIDDIREIIAKGLIVDSPDIGARQLPNGQTQLYLKTPVATTIAAAGVSPIPPPPPIGFGGSFTEFYCDPVNGSNLNGGSSAAATAAYTSTNGGWNSGTQVFTPTDGSNPSTTVNVGDFASVYLDGATVGVFIGRVTNVVNAVNGAITISATASAGTSPATLATGRTIKVGGALKGPNAGSSFPFNLSSGNGIASLKNASGYIPRFNMKNNASYSVTNGVTLSSQGPYILQGYTSVVADGGRALIDGGATLTYVVSFTTSIHFIDIEAKSSAAGGTAAAFTTSGGGSFLVRCVAHGARGPGFDFANTGNIAVECEAYDCNKSNTNGMGGFVFSSQCVAWNCISHDNAGSNNDGFTTYTSTASVWLLNSIADSNGRHGFSGTPATIMEMAQCDAYNNGGDGFRNSNTTLSSFAIIKNCNFINNAGYGINSTISTGRWTGLIMNCGFYGNTSGETNNTDMMGISNSVHYSAVPYANPAAGDFDLTLAEAQGTGRGNFLQTQSGYTGSQGFPDIGASQHF